MNITLPQQACLRARQQGLRLTENLLWVQISQQTMFHFRALHCPCEGHSNRLSPEYALVKKFVASTSRYGIGEVAGSNMTPRGLHRIAEKVGGGWPVGTVFKSRQVVGFTWKGLPLAPITTRIFWLEGLEAGFNRGGNVDSHARFIYIHGTGDETTLGRPSSHGCVHLAANDLIPLYDQLPSGTLVWISEK
jgi:hypothetical protein